MIIKRLSPAGGGTIVEALRSRQADADRRRPKGLHVSTIINAIVDRLHPPDDKLKITDTSMMFMQEIGNIIEDVIGDELALRSGWSKPQPKVIDGIILSPDGWAPRSRTIDEMKSTRVSCGKIKQRADGRIEGLEEHPRLMKHVLQIKTYMYGWDADRGRLHELFLMGDWRPTRAGFLWGVDGPPFPQPQPFIIRPESKYELRDHWEMIKDFATEEGWLK